MDSLRIFLIGGEEEVNELIPALQGWGHRITGSSQDVYQSLGQIRNLNPDLVFLDSSATGNDLREQYLTLAEGNIPLVLQINFTQRELVQGMEDKGLFPYLVKPVPQEVYPLVIELALHSYRHIHRLEEEVKRLRNELASRKLIEKAKGILMESLGVSEKEAFRRIQKQSMNKRISMKKVSEAIIMAHDMES